MDLLFIILLSTIFVSLFAFSGTILYLINEKKLQTIVIYLVAFSAGSLLGGAFIHLIPEGLESFIENNNNFLYPSLFIFLGILIFYIIEKFLHWHHHHELNCKKHIIGPIALIGGGFHKLIDGFLISAAFIYNIELGFSILILIIIHKIPMEIGNFALMMHSGYKRNKIIFLNYLSSSMTIIGGIIGYYLISSQSLIPKLLLITAGGFIYISLSDIIPELNDKKINIKLVNLLLLFGIILSYILKLLLE